MPFQEGHWAVLLLPDDTERLIQVKSEGTVDLGRFGKFQSRQLIGKIEGTYWELVADGTLKGMESKDVMVVRGEWGSGSVEEELATNQSLLDSNTSQRLGMEEIEQLKGRVDAGELDARGIVETVVAHSETFDRKNAYSKVKYLQRKKRKDLRIDTLAQILCMANIQPHGGRFLVWDETMGYLMGAILSKTATSHVTGVYKGQQMQTHLLLYYNFGNDERERLHGLSIEAFGGTSHRNKEEEEIFVEKEGADPSHVAIQKERFARRLERRKMVREWLDQRLFDGLIIATCSHEPGELIDRLAPYLRPSSRLVVYSTWRDLLLPPYMQMRREGEWVDVMLSESWMRPYQAAPGRFHPHMTCNGHGGTLLTATKIIPSPSTSKP